MSGFISEIRVEGLSATQQALEEIGVLLGRDLGDLVREQSALLGKDLILLTPPTNKGGVYGLGFKESMASQFRVGKKAIQRDLGRVYVRVSAVAAAIRYEGTDEDRRAAAGFVRAANRGEVDEARAILRRYNFHQPKTIGKFEERHHRGARNAKGRVTAQIIRHVVTDVTEIRNYQKRLEEKLMIGKAGWYAAAVALGTKGIHRSVTRHGARYGRKVDRTQRGAAKVKDPTFLLINDVRYVVAQNAEFSTVPRAESRRRNQIERRLHVLRDKRVRGRI